MTKLLISMNVFFLSWLACWKKSDIQATGASNLLGAVILYPNGPFLTGISLRQCDARGLVNAD
jgi:hypothetical protein